MKLKIITISKPKADFQNLFDEYLKRLSGFYFVQVAHVKDGKNAESQVLKEIENCYSVFLDEKGKSFSSVELTNFFKKRKNEGISNLAFVIGGPDGHSDKIKKKADFLWSLSDLTFPHDLAMVILVETLYRSATIEVGHPYHRA